MAKPRPLEVHVNSKGARKHLMLQELIHDEEQYLFLPLSGHFKTDLYNKGFLDGRKEVVQLYQTYSECSDMQPAVLSMSRGLVNQDLGKNNEFSGIIRLDKTFLIHTLEANRFIQNYCMDCECIGMEKCYKQLEYDCGEEDRERYRDTPNLMRQQEIRKSRRKHIPFPG